MLNIFKAWFDKNFSDPEAVLLSVLLALGLFLIVVLGEILTPVLASLIIAYFLRGWVIYLEKMRVPSGLATILVYIGFLAIFSVSLLIVLPLLWKQIISLFTDLPSMIQKAKTVFLLWIEEYPAYFSQEQLDILVSGLLHDVQSWGKSILSVSLSSIPGVIVWIVYLVLVPLLVFFFLKDYKVIVQWFSGFLPVKRKVLKTVWIEMDEQIGNYVQGKVTEITIVALCTYLVFLYFNLNYAMLLAVLVGLSVVIPYVGAIVVTFPVGLVAYLQWGWSPEFMYVSIAYLVIHALDGNVLVPLLFSEAVNLHPVAIMIAILFFGAIWGVWGVFFAIPLATLVKAVLNAWPEARQP